MSNAGIHAVEALIGDVDSVIDRLDEGTWQADSACHSWRVQDVITHLGFFFHMVADPRLALPDNPDGTVEALNDATVWERADWPFDQAAAYYRRFAPLGLAVLESLEDEDQRDLPLDMDDLGAYKMHQLSDALAFDHLVHLLCDLFAPYGPVPPTELSVGTAIDPAIDWMMAGLPQMCGAAVSAALTRPVGLTLSGATERSFRLEPAADETGLHVVETDDLPTEHVSTSATEFLRWATKRSAWRSVCETSGDRQVVASVLDAIAIV
jgi:hypothetical protein